MTINGTFTERGHMRAIVCNTGMYWAPEQIESAWRHKTRIYHGKFELPSLGYSSEQDTNGRKKVLNAESITEEHQALWCEMAKHPFSAKDPDKVVMSARGDSRLACGPCAGAVFGGKEEPAAVEAAPRHARTDGPVPM